MICKSNKKGMLLLFPFLCVLSYFIIWNLVLTSLSSAGPYVAYFTWKVIPNPANLFSDSKCSFKISYFKSTFIYQAQIVRKKNELNLVCLCLGYSFSTVFLVECKVTAGLISRILVVYGSFTVFANLPREWEHGQELCSQLIFMGLLSSNIDQGNLQGIFRGMQWQNHCEEQGRLRTERLQRPPVNHFTFLHQDH